MITRRTFIYDTAVVSAAALCGCENPEKTVFNADERACLIAMAEQIVPADPQCGGATDAGAINYFENWVGKYYPEIRPIYRSGLVRVMGASRKLFNEKFQDLDFDTQFKFMSLMQRGKIDDKSWSAGDQKFFFFEIRTRTMQAFYGSPRHGGNKNYMSYKMLGLQMPIVTGQNRYGRES